MYITQEELESYLGIEFEDDNMAQILINGIESAVNSYIGADGPNGILTTEYRETIDVRSVILNEDGYNVYLKHGPVSNSYENPIKVNDIEVNNQETPRVIVRGRQLMIKNLSAWVDENNIKDTWNWLTVTYTAGYGTYDEGTQQRTGIPEDIKMVCLFLCSVIRITKDYVGMTNYRLGDESISLGRKNYVYGNPIISDTLKKYRKIYIAY